MQNGTAAAPVEPASERRYPYVDPAGGVGFVGRGIGGGGGPAGRASPTRLPRGPLRPRQTAGSIPARSTHRTSTRPPSGRSRTVTPAHSRRPRSRTAARRAAARPPGCRRARSSPAATRRRSGPVQADVDLRKCTALTGSSGTDGHHLREDRTARRSRAGSLPGSLPLGSGADPANFRVTVGLFVRHVLPTGGSPKTIDRLHPRPERRIRRHEDLHPLLKEVAKSQTATERQKAPVLIQSQL